MLDADGAPAGDLSHSLDGPSGTAADSNTAEKCAHTQLAERPSHRENFHYDAASISGAVDPGVTVPLS